MKTWFYAVVLAGCGGNPPPVQTDTSAAGTSEGEDSGSTIECAGAQTACAGDCADLLNDPENCGACGRTCLVLNGVGGCISGQCALAECDAGWGDCDGDMGNGCELPSDCEDRSACETTCGSVGSAVCDDVCDPVCVIPVESCNAIDDDCDGDCDEGELAGCRRAAYRSSGALGHVYGIDPAEAGALGQTLESERYFYVYADETADLAPLYRCDKGAGRRLLTLSATCEIGVEPELVVGWVSRTERCGAVPLYRLYSGAASNHFYTLSAVERDNAVAVYGYSYESVAGYVWATP